VTPAVYIFLPIALFAAAFYLMRRGRLEKEAESRRAEAEASEVECPTCGELLPDSVALESHVAQFHPGDAPSDA
jgi:hypothetical protein